MQNEINRQYVSSQIQLKNSYHPYHYYGNDKKIITDMDHFPYTRFYRGIYNESVPIIWEREAGYHKLENRNYEYTPIFSIQKPQNCFQLPCSTILPCQPSSKPSLSMNNDSVNISP